MPQRSRKIAGVISEVMIESSTKHDLLYSPSIADAPKASLKDHTGRGAAGLCEDRPRPNRRKKTLRTKLFAAFGAGDEARTRYLHLGKVALYRMSYTRRNVHYYSRNREFVKTQNAKNERFLHTAYVPGVSQNCLETPRFSLCAYSARRKTSRPGAVSASLLTR